MADIYFGIDFGTTCCAPVGYAKKSGLQQLEQYDADGHPVPSIIAIDKETGEIYRGASAKAKRNELQNNCVVFRSIKSVIDEEKEYYINDRKWTPVDIAGEIFKELKQIIEKRTEGIDITSATVAIPVGFDANKRRCLREAAGKAGIEIDAFVSEPTAAFFANYEELRGNENVVIFDWGGGTLDITVLQNKNGKINELASKGLKLAGDDIDEKLARRVHARIAKKNSYEVNFDEMPASDRDKMLIEAENAKIALGEDDEVEISIAPYGDLAYCLETIHYEWFEDIIENEIEKAIDLLHQTIEESELGIQNIDRIVLVGGSSNLRPLLIRLDAEYGDKLYCPEKTEWNVGTGAARLNSNPGSYYSSQEFGIVLSDGEECLFLKKGTMLDNWKQTVSFGLTDTSKEARFIFCGSHDINSSESRYHTMTVPTYRFLYEKINVTVEVTEDRILRVLGKSSMKPDSEQVVWEYPNLKCVYQFEE